jgi:hypothetical protein
MVYWVGTQLSCVRIGDMIATFSLSADPAKQQIPPLRCAPVGMTYYVSPGDRLGSWDDRLFSSV